MDERPFGMNNLYEKESHSPTKSVVPWTIGCSPDAKKKTALKALAFFFHSFIHSFTRLLLTKQSFASSKPPLPNAKKPNGREEEDEDERLQKNQ